MAPRSPAHRTAAQRTADKLLPAGVDAFVAERRLTDRPLSWRLVARDLYDATQGLVDVSHETLRSWYAERVAS